MPVILLSDSSSQSLIIVAVVVLGMWSTTVHCQVQYSNRFDTTTATLRHVLVMIKQLNRGIFVRVDMQCIAQLLLSYMCLFIGSYTVKQAGYRCYP